MLSSNKISTNHELQKQTKNWAESIPVNSSLVGTPRVLAGGILHAFVLL